MTSTDSGLASRGTIGGTLYHAVDPEKFYAETRKDIFVTRNFREEVVENAVPVESGFYVGADSADITRRMTDDEIEISLEGNHFFDETSLCALVASLIARQAQGQEGALVTKGGGNLFYTRFCVVIVRWTADRKRWGVAAYHRDEGRWGVGERVFYPRMPQW